MNPLLNQFVEETRDFLQSISTSLLALENAHDDPELLDTLFRSVHTLKGNSGLFHLPLMTGLLHAAEDLMDAVRQGDIPFTPALADALLDAMDKVDQLTDDAEANDGAESFSDPQAIEVSVAALRAWMPAAVSADHEPDTQPELAAAELPLSLDCLPESVLADAIERCCAIPGQLHWIVYQPDAQCFFNGDDPLHRVQQTPGLLWFAVQDGAAEPLPLEEFDCYQCHLIYHVLAEANIEELSDHYQYVLTDCRMLPLDARSLGCEANPVFSQVQSDVKANLQAVAEPARGVVLGDRPEHLTELEWHFLNDAMFCQRQSLLLASEVPWQRGQVAASTQTLRACMHSAGKGTETFERAASEAERQGKPDPLTSWLDDIFEPAPISVSEESATVTTDEPQYGRRADDGVKSRALKIEPEKIDRLMNLIGEIVVSKNALPYLATRAEEEYGCPALAREIKDQYGMISRIAEELQDAILQTRMLPVSFVFQRFPRLVRDIARKLGKQVEFTQEGGETEADKAIIEALSDPLIHVVRNTLDHGIEMPEQRVSAGKSATGQLAIQASQQSDRVIIEVRDDGNGIDVDRVKAKAVAQQLITPEVAESLSDQEIINLVFEPGFSTADTVSDLSGRGVGMDVVRTAVEQIGGEVSIWSQKGEGTRVTFALPVSMAMTRVMIIKSDEQLFGVPMDMVRETVRLRPEAIHRVRNQPSAELRGELIPLVGLNEVLALDKPQELSEDEENTVIFVRVGQESVGLMVDDVQEVADLLLKPLPGQLGNIPAYAGSALLGDGTVLMVLNPRGLF